MPLLNSAPEYEDDALKSGLVVKPLKGLKAFFNPYGAISANDANLAYRQLLAENQANLVQHGLLAAQDTDTYGKRNDLDIIKQRNMYGVQNNNFGPAAAAQTAANIASANTFGGVSPAISRTLAGMGTLSPGAMGAYDNMIARNAIGLPAAQANADLKQAGAEGSGADLIAANNALQMSPDYRNPYAVSAINQQKINAGLTGQTVSNLPLLQDTSRQSAINENVAAAFPTLANGHSVVNTYNPVLGNVTQVDNGLGMGATSEQRDAEMMSKKLAEKLGGAAPNAYGLQGASVIGRSHPLTVSGEKMHRGGIPVEDADSHKGTFADPSTPPKKMTLGQRLLKQIIPTIASGNPQAYNDPAFKNYMGSILMKRKEDEDRIHELTSLLTNPPTKVENGQRISIYNHKQLEDMAKELDKLSGQ